MDSNRQCVRFISSLRRHFAAGSSRCVRSDLSSTAWEHRYGAGYGPAGYAGDNGSATAADLNGPHSVAIDATGNIYIADMWNNCIRKVTASTGIITTVAGN